jgi:hypothetical protein
MQGNKWCYWNYQVQQHESEWCLHGRLDYIVRLKTWFFDTTTNEHMANKKHWFKHLKKINYPHVGCTSRQWCCDLGKRDQWHWDSNKWERQVGNMESYMISCMFLI